MTNCLEQGVPRERVCCHSQQEWFFKACAWACALQKVGMKPVERFVEQVDDVRKKKLSEMVVTEEAAGPQRSQCNTLPPLLPLYPISVP